MKKITVTSPELNKLILEKFKLVDEGIGLTNQIEKLETKRNGVALKVQKVKDKIIPLVEKLSKPHLAEFEYVTKADVKGKKDVVIEYVDAVEEFKKDYKERKESYLRPAKENNENTTN